MNLKRAKRKRNESVFHRQRADGILHQIHKRCLCKSIGNFYACLGLAAKGFVEAKDEPVALFV